MTILRLETSNPAYARPNTQTLTIHSSHLNRRQDVTIYNAASKSTNLPVVILLHGVYGNHWVWMDLGGVHLVYEQLRAQGLGEFILVMPSDGGLWDGSAYLPLGKQGNYEQWIIDDVMAAVKQTVPAATNNSRWYITGLSMGGYGALRLGSKYADKFSGISGHSSITQIGDMKHFVQTPLSQYQCEQPNEESITHWCQLNKASLPPIRFDCGTEDVLYKSNLLFKEQLTQLNIPFVFEPLTGSHEWPYWHKNIAKTFSFFDAIEKNK